MRRWYATAVGLAAALPLIAGCSHGGADEAPETTEPWWENATAPTSAVTPLSTPPPTAAPPTAAPTPAPSVTATAAPPASGGIQSTIPLLDGDPVTLTMGTVFPIARSPFATGDPRREIEADFYEAMTWMTVCRSHPAACDIAGLAGWFSGDALAALTPTIQYDRDTNRRLAYGPAARYRVTAIDLSSAAAVVSACVVDDASGVWLDASGAPTGSTVFPVDVDIGKYQMLVSATGQWTIDAQLSTATLDGGNVSCD